MFSDDAHGGARSGVRGRGNTEWTVYIGRAHADQTSLVSEVNKQTP